MFHPWASVPSLAKHQHPGFSHVVGSCSEQQVVLWCFWWLLCDMHICICCVICPFDSELGIWNGRKFPSFSHYNLCNFIIFFHYNLCNQFLLCFTQGCFGGTHHWKNGKSSWHSIRVLLGLELCKCLLQGQQDKEHSIRVSDARDKHNGAVPVCLSMCPSRPNCAIAFCLLLEPRIKFPSGPLFPSLIIYSYMH